MDFKIARIPLLLTAVGLAVYGPSFTASAQEHHHPSAAHSHSMTAREEAIKPQIPDVVLTDQNGRQHHFYSDLVKGKLVLMNSIYTSCQGSCPMQTAIFNQVHKALGDRVGRDVQMISLSVDPTTDTPERLKAFAKKLKVGDDDGWTFLTGSQQNVTLVLKAMDLYSATPEDHTPILAVGNEPAGIWMKAINLAAPADIINRIDHVKTLGDQRNSGG